MHSVLVNLLVQYTEHTFLANIEVLKNVNELHSKLIIYRITKLTKGQY